MSDPHRTHKRMIAFGTVVVAGLCTAIWVVSPPRGAPATPSASARRAKATPPEPGPTGPRLGGPCDTCSTGTLCFTDRAVPDGVCSKRCARGRDCPEGWCCLDSQGAGDPQFFFCAPPVACAGRVPGTPP